MKQLPRVRCITINDKDEVWSMNCLFRGLDLDDSSLPIKFDFITKNIIKKGLQRAALF